MDYNSKFIFFVAGIKNLPSCCCLYTSEIVLNAYNISESSYNSISRIT